MKVYYFVICLCLFKGEILVCWRQTVVHFVDEMHCWEPVSICHVKGASFLKTCLIKTKTYDQGFYFSDAHFILF